MICVDTDYDEELDPARVPCPVCEGWRTVETLTGCGPLRLVRAAVAEELEQS